jgi:hypothetical protein
MGVEITTLKNLWFDFINLFVVTMYFLLYRNPIICGNVDKITDYALDNKLKEYNSAMCEKEGSDMTY